MLRSVVAPSSRRPPAVRLASRPAGLLARPHSRFALRARDTPRQALRTGVWTSVFVCGQRCLQTRGRMKLIQAVHELTPALLGVGALVGCGSANIPSTTLRTLAKRLRSAAEKAPCPSLSRSLVNATASPRLVPTAVGLLLAASGRHSLRWRSWASRSLALQVTTPLGKLPASSPVRLAVDDCRRPSPNAPSAVADADLTLLAVSKLGSPRPAFAGKTVWIVGASQGIGQAVRAPSPLPPLRRSLSRDALCLLCASPEKALFSSAVPRWLLGTGRHWYAIPAAVAAPATHHTGGAHACGPRRPPDALRAAEGRPRRGGEGVQAPRGAGGSGGDDGPPRRLCVPPGEL